LCEIAVPDADAGQIAYLRLAVTRNHQRRLIAGFGRKELLQVFSQGQAGLTRRSHRLVVAHGGIAVAFEPRYHSGIQNREGMKMKITWGLALIGLSLAPLGWAQTLGTPEQELVTVENTWKQAVVDRDAGSLNRLYADDYFTTDQEGMVWYKAQDIAIDTTGHSRLVTYKLDDLNVRLYGDVAVVTGRNISTGTILGNATKSQSRFTDVFVKRDGRWQCVTSQVTPITGD
jgi:ketosteroid isomerase-like protein